MLILLKLLAWVLNPGNARRFYLHLHNHLCTINSQKILNLFDRGPVRTGGVWILDAIFGLGRPIGDSDGPMLSTLDIIGVDVTTVENWSNNYQCKNFPKRHDKTSKLSDCKLFFE